MGIICMQAYEFYTKCENGMIEIPEMYKDIILDTELRSLAR
jgi:hypothetical protein